MSDSFIARLQENIPHETTVDSGLTALISMFHEVTDPILVLLAGGTGAGKSSIIAERLQAALPDLVVVFPLDMFYWGKSIIKAMEIQHGRSISWDEPLAIDFAGAIQQVKLLQQGKAAVVPEYNFVRSEREGERRISPKPIILVEGLFALHAQFREMSHYGIFVDVDIHGQIIRRVLRDIIRKDREPNDILFELAQTALPLQHRHVESTQAFADVIIKNDFRPETEMLRRASSRPQVKVGRWPIPGRLTRMDAECVSRTKQEDQYFTANDRDLALTGEEFRFRTEAEELSLAYKGPKVGPNGERFVFTCSIEPETAEALQRYYRSMLVQVIKKRRIFEYERMLISLDTVSIISPHGTVFDSKPVTEIRMLRSSEFDRDAVDKVLLDLGLDPARSTLESYFSIALNPSLLPLE